MVKTTQRNAPAPKHDTATAATGSEDSAATNVTTLNTSKGRSQVNKPSLLASVREDDTKRIADKLTLVGSTKQRLAEAHDLYAMGDDKNAEATAIADKAAVNLYQARAGGVLNQEEVSTMLGDIWGFKPKSDGSPGKTPMGQGEAIRKRVVRAVQADDYANDRDTTAFFSGLPEQEVKDILAAVVAGDMSIFTAYDKFAELKRENATRVNAAFDPKKIGAIFDALAENGGQSAADIFAHSPALVAAYAAMREALDVVDEIAAGIVADEAKAA